MPSSVWVPRLRGLIRKKDEFQTGYQLEVVVLFEFDLIKKPKPSWLPFFSCGIPNKYTSSKEPRAIPLLVDRAEPVVVEFHTDPVLVWVEANYYKALLFESCSSLSASIVVTYWWVMVVKREYLLLG